MAKSMPRLPEGSRRESTWIGWDKAAVVAMVLNACMREEATETPAATAPTKSVAESERLNPDGLSRGQTRVEHPRGHLHRCCW